eukprot:TRINITY_DN7266_c0_g1_i1.p1 TRINITY_DN7266_c0_g1~~TRINITY_DN7266_c0_g1_i1.p1  ORF type:complete len:484 (+),score=189.07 TRINITY_DN7266_c0_g1_i1:101-1453(+)
MAEISGMLRKSGGGPLKRDQDRWFELIGKNLYYYKQKPGSDKQEQPLGCIKLQDTVCQDEPKKKFGFTIQGPALSKPYTLFATSAEEKKSWMDAIVNSKDGGGPGLQVQGDSDDEDAKGGGTEQTVGLDDFEPLCVVGKGSFGKVMQVRKKDTGEIFAMKSMYKEVILRENLVDHTNAEKNILGMINHPFIVNLHYAFQTADKLYLVLDFLSGGEVFYHLSQCGVFPEARAKFYTAQIGLAISHLHSLNIIYRDLKPENCVLDKDGNCCITDFGLAKPNIQGQDAKTFCGTPEYLAPEFLTGGGHGKAVDWWSLGILLYEMITGLPPFYSENVNEMYELILRKPLNFADESAQIMSEPAKAICTRMLERDPDERMQEIDDFKKHAFFSDMDWEAMMAKKLPVPFKPDPSKLHFDDEFTSEPARHSMASKAGGSSNACEFKNFTYVGKKGS